MMTTSPKTATSTTSPRTIETELLCVCGRTLYLNLPVEGFLDAAQQTAKASRWKVCDDYQQDIGPKLDGYCPNCFNSHV